MNRTTNDSIGAGTGSLKSYTLGFILSIILTALAFGLVMIGAAPRWLMVSGILGMGISQIVVHLHYFLHLDTSSSARWNVLALLLTVLIMALFVGGTLWIMHHLKYRLL